MIRLWDNPTNFHKQKNKNQYHCTNPQGKSWSQSKRYSKLVAARSHINDCTSAVPKPLISVQSISLFVSLVITFPYSLCLKPEPWRNGRSLQWSARKVDESMLWEWTNPKLIVKLFPSSPTNQFNLPRQPPNVSIWETQLAKTSWYLPSCGEEFTVQWLFSWHD